METSTWMMGGAAAGIIATGWDKIKFVIGRIKNLFYETIRIEDNAMNGFLILMNKEFYRSPYGEKVFSCRHRYIKPLKKYITIGCERFDSRQPVVFWKGWRPLLVHKTPDEKSEALLGNRKPESITVSFLRKTWDRDLLIQKSVEEYNKAITDTCNESNKNTKRHFIHKFIGSGNKTKLIGLDNITGYITQGSSIICDSTVRFLKWKFEDIGYEHPDKKSEIESLAFPVEINTLIDEIRMWKESENWYIERHIPWKRGWLIYGQPGNGKTSLTRALGIDLDMPIFSFDLSSLTNSEMVMAWREARKYSPCIVLFEDIDTVFHSRENIVGQNGGGLTFDCLLNCLDGVENNNGMFIIITTNHLDKIDSAIGVPHKGKEFSSRPGRIDRAFEIKPPDAACRRKIAENILRDNPEEIDYMVGMGFEDSATQFQLRCQTRALDLFWRKKYADWHPPLKYVA